MKNILFILGVFLINIQLSATEKKLGAATSAGRWVKVARIQNTNPINGGEVTSFSGTLNAQTDIGQTGSAQYYAIFSFGSRGGIKPLLQEFGDAANRVATDISRIEWRIYKDTEGWHYLWLWQSNYSKYATFNYENYGGIEYWTFENPPADYTQVWSSIDGVRQHTNATYNFLNANDEIGVGNQSTDNWSKYEQVYNDAYGFNFQHNNASAIVNEQGTTNQALVLADVDNGYEMGPLFGLAIKQSGGEWEPKFNVMGNGNVGIGTTTPKNKLSVNGTIWATKVKVTLEDAADWVFEDSYKLRPLSEVAAFIKNNKHLPEIPSADEFRANDMDVSEMTNKLLQKIEELTLYTIEQEEKLKKVEALQIQNNELAVRLAKLEALLVR